METKVKELATRVQFGWQVYKTGWLCHAREREKRTTCPHNDFIGGRKFKSRESWRAAISRSRWEVSISRDCSDDIKSHSAREDQTAIQNSTRVLMRHNWGRTTQNCQKGSVQSHLHTKCVHAKSLNNNKRIAHRLTKLLLFFQRFSGNDSYLRDFYNGLD